MVTFEQITQEMAMLYKRKNADYGNSFDNTLNEFGLVAGLIRVNDKINRLKQLYKAGTQQVQDEKLEDTLIDLANYAVMTLTWLKNNK